MSGDASCHAVGAVGVAGRERAWGERIGIAARIATRRARA
jgi:hypothetical protein